MTPPRVPGGDMRELVVLAHGLGRTPASMWWLARSLRARGYRVLNWGYPSYTLPVPVLGERLARDVAAALGDAPAVHFVGHSLGTVLIRWVLAHDPPPRPGRVVMLAPPNRGARKADRVAPYAGWLLPPLADLRTAADAPARALAAPAGVEVGIIAGASDRTVRVAETHLDGAAGHVLVPGGHTFIMLRADVHRLVHAFLARGTFAT
ncbi:MAG: alpha/beta fold hydrolase [Gemmatimonadetes bacterium]|nr:alpha/beta fold hydrolase [Gemmatimonadota bacterium]